MGHLADRPAHILALILAVFLLGSGQLVTAQGDGTSPTTPGSITIHVVQRDENLFRIAMRYGTTVEAITEANGITDPRYISVGQRLLIPNAQTNTSGVITTYTVQPGDSLDTIVQAHQTTIESLAASNQLTNPALLYIGQEITISQGAADPASSTTKRVYYVQPGENIFQIAVGHRVPLNTLLAANDLTLPAPVFTGQRLWVPATGDTASPAAGDFLPPFVSFAISPIPPQQGSTASIHVTTATPATLSGTFASSPLYFVTQDATQHFALVGIHIFTQPSVYPLEIIATGADGTQTALHLRVRVNPGGFDTEAISLGTDQQSLLDPGVTEPEWERIATIMSSVTSQRYFDGLMALPSPGAISSQFGTQRTYNEGALDTFHSGIDIAGGPGTPVVASSSGAVVLAESLPVRGNAIIIDHGWGVFTGYWHLSEMSVTVGTIVSAGQTIGAIGSTGRSTGPHLHWEMWVGGVQVDPMQWVRQSFP